MAMIKFFALSITAIFYVACNSELGYDPSDRYSDKAVDFIVDDLSYNGPKCNSSSEGDVFYVESNSTVYACIDEKWTKMRELKTDEEIDEELANAVQYKSGEPAKRKIPSVDYRESSFTDARNGRTYKTTIVDGIEWMAENLDYDDGNSMVSSLCSRSFGEANCRLYKVTYGSALGSSSLNDVCPDGFRLPSDREWESLFEILGGEYTAGKMLKAVSSETNREFGGMDLVKFSALPAGGYISGYETSVGERAMFRTYDAQSIAIMNTSDWAGVVSDISYEESATSTVFKGIDSRDYYSIRCMRYR
jgi:uncharacterized protein (TIGR02145 family)